MVPGDIIDIMLAENDFGADTKNSRAALESALGLDKPIYVQYISWISGIALRGDFGKKTNPRYAAPAETAALSVSGVDSPQILT